MAGDSAATQPLGCDGWGSPIERAEAAELPAVKMALVHRGDLAELPFCVENSRHPGFLGSGMSFAFLTAISRVLSNRHRDGGWTCDPLNLFSATDPA